MYQDPDNRLEDWDDYKYRPRFSNIFVSTYTKSGNLIFAIRGTKDLEDLVLDLEIPSGVLLSERVKSLFELVNKAVKDFRGEFGEVTFTGHSLGGLLSPMMSTEILDSKGVIFNAATAPWLQQGKPKRVKITAS